MPPSPAPKSDGGFLPVRGRHRRGFGGPSASAAGALGAQRFRKRPFVPKAAPGPRRDPSPRGTRSSQVTTSAPRMWEAARTKRQTSRPGRPCPNTHTLGRGWNPPRQGAGGVPAPKADHPQGLRPSPREDAGRRGRVLRPPRREKGAPLRTPPPPRPRSRLNVQTERGDAPRKPRRPTSHEQEHRSGGLPAAPLCRPLGSLHSRAALEALDQAPSRSDGPRNTRQEATRRRQGQQRPDSAPPPRRCGRAPRETGFWTPGGAGAAGLGLARDSSFLPGEGSPRGRWRPPSALADAAPRARCTSRPSEQHDLRQGPG